MGGVPHRLSLMPTYFHTRHLYTHIQNHNMFSGLLVMALYKRSFVINSLPLFLETFVAFYQLKSKSLFLLLRSPYETEVTIYKM